MKRHEALIPLSREHHQFLVLAQLLKIDAPTYPKLPQDLHGKFQYAKRMHEELMQQHWKKEEEVLFEQIEGVHPDIDQLLYVLKDDHTELNERLEKLAGEVNQAFAMNEIATLLEQHVRTEERELFEKIQQHCTEEQLKALGSALEA